MAHVGVGAFHRCHQAEFTDDMLAAASAAGASSASISARRASPRRSARRTASTRARCAARRRRRGARRRLPRRASSTARTSRGRRSPCWPRPTIDVVTLTVTEKAYCHRPATGRARLGPARYRRRSRRPRARRRACPGLLVRAARAPPAAGAAGPITLMSCDNIPANGVVLGERRRAPSPSAAAPRSRAGSPPTPPFPRPWSTASSPATTPADLASVERRSGYRDARRRGRRAVPPMGDRGRFAGPPPALGPRRRRRSSPT